MATTYRTRQGEVLDMIAFRAYGRRPGMVEMLLAANRGIADLGPVLPIGTLVVLPDVAPQALTPAMTIKLWD